MARDNLRFMGPEQQCQQTPAKNRGPTQGQKGQRATKAEVQAGPRAPHRARACALPAGLAAASTGPPVTSLQPVGRREEMDTGMGKHASVEAGRVGSTLRGPGCA